MNKEKAFKQIQEHAQAIAAVLKKIDKNTVNISISIDLNDNYLSVSNANWGTHYASFNEYSFEFMKGGVK